jgi:hypothetical protein
MPIPKRNCAIVWDDHLPGWDDAAQTMDPTLLAGWFAGWVANSAASPCHAVALTTEEEKIAEVDKWRQLGYHHVQVMTVDEVIERYTYPSVRDETDDNTGFEIGEDGQLLKFWRDAHGKRVAERPW